MKGLCSVWQTLDTYKMLLSLLLVYIIFLFKTTHGPHPCGGEKNRQLIKQCPMKSEASQSRWTPDESGKPGTGSWGSQRGPGGRSCLSFSTRSPAPGTVPGGSKLSTEGREGGREKRWGWPRCPSLCRMEGCNPGTGHRTPCVTHGTIGFSSPGLEWHLPAPLHTHSPRPSLLSPTPCTVRGAAQACPIGRSLHCVFLRGGERGTEKMGRQQVGWELDTSECCETEPPVNFV